MNFLKQSMQGMGATQSSNGALPPQLMGAIQDIKRMRAVCGGNMQAMVNQIAAARPEIGQALKAAQSGNPQQIVEQLCRKQGIDVNAFMRALQS